MKQNAPLVMFAFNRPEWLRIVLDRLVKAPGVNDRDSFMFIDGPRNDKDKVSCGQVYEHVLGYASQLPRLKIIRRDVNMGCRKNIIAGITEVVDKYGKVIVVEDDILVSDTFFAYMDQALEFYNDDKRIWSINAYQNHNMKVPRGYKLDVYLNAVNNCWGWGTWRDRWDAVDFDMSDWSALRNDEAMVAKLNAAGKFKIPMIEDQLAGRINTWDIQCTYHCVKNGLMSVEPIKRLSKNIGFSSTIESTHCKSDNPEIVSQKYYNFQPKLVKGLQPDKRIMCQLADIDDPPVTNLIVKKLMRSKEGRCLLRVMDNFKVRRFNKRIPKSMVPCAVK